MEASVTTQVVEGAELHAAAGVAPAKKCADCYYLAALFAGLGILAFACDLPVARALYAHEFPGEIRDLLQVAEFFGHVWGVVLVLFAIYFLDRAQFRHMPRILAASIGAGLAADVGKLLIARLRPHAADLDSTSVFDTFESWFPLFSSANRLQGFPSAHTAVASGFAVCLTIYYPKGKPLFITLAILCAAQRLQAHVHFPSDIMFGAAIGLVVGASCFALPAADRMFDRISRSRRFATSVGTETGGPQHRPKAHDGKS